MTLADAKASPESYVEASALFEQASKESKRKNRFASIGAQPLLQGA